MVAAPGVQPAGHLIWVVLHVLKRLEHAQRLVDGATERLVVDGGVLDPPHQVDDVQTAERYRLRTRRRFADFALEIAHERVVQVTETAVVSVSLEPRQVRKLESTEQPRTSVSVGELLVAIGEGGDFRRATKVKSSG